MKGVSGAQTPQLHHRELSEKKSLFSSWLQGMSPEMSCALVCHLNGMLVLPTLAFNTAACRQSTTSVEQNKTSVELLWN